MVIRQRLAGRCAPAAGPQVWITHAAVTRARGRDLELFLATGNEPILATIEGGETTRDVRVARALLAEIA